MAKPPVPQLRNHKPRFVSRLVNPKVRSNVVRLGAPDRRWSDGYHFLLTISWVKLLGLLSLMYVAINAVFAIAYLLDPAEAGGIANSPNRSFADAFFFSVQTMASIGYGAMYPQTLYSNIVVSIEALLGLFWLTLATGLMFARFSRPTALVLFSNVAVITMHNGIPTLMLRAANQRGNQIFEAQMRLTLVRNLFSQEGEYMRRFFDLRLERAQTSIFALTWTAFHPIDEFSPLFEIVPEELEEMEAEIVVTLTGTDETFSQTVHARYSYLPHEILWDVRFADIISRLPDGRRAVDYSRFHDVVPLNS